MRKKGLNYSAKSIPKEIQDKILDRLALGETLTDICNSSKEFPSRITIIRFARNNEDFRIAYTHAREDQQHAFADEILRRSKDESRDYYVDDKGVRRSDNTSVMRDRLIVDSMKFLMAKLAPNIYGDKPDLMGNINVEGNVTVNILPSAKPPTLKATDTKEIDVLPKKKE